MAQRNLENLPPETQTAIIIYLETKGIGRLAQTCQTLWQLSLSDDIWKDILERDYKNHSNMGAEIERHKLTWKNVYKSLYIADSLGSILIDFSIDTEPLEISNSSGFVATSLKRMLCYLMDNPRVPYTTILCAVHKRFCTTDKLVECVIQGNRYNKKGSALLMEQIIGSKEVKLDPTLEQKAMEFFDKKKRPLQELKGEHQFKIPSNSRPRRIDRTNMYRNRPLLLKPTPPPQLLKALSFQTIHPAELAAQLTLITSSRFSSIARSDLMEYLDTGTNTAIETVFKGDKKIREWIQKEYQDAPDTPVFINAMVEIARTLNSINNVHDLRIVIDAIRSLKPLDETEKALQQIESNCLFVKGKPFPKLSVAIPQLQYLFDELKQMDEQAPTFTPDNLINWQKFGSMGYFMDKFILCRSTSYTPTYVTETRQVKKWIEANVFKMLVNPNPLPNPIPSRNPMKPSFNIYNE